MEIVNQTKIYGSGWFLMKCSLVHQLDKSQPHKKYRREGERELEKIT